MWKLSLLKQSQARRPGCSLVRQCSLLEHLLPLLSCSDFGLVEPARKSELWNRRRSLAQASYYEPTHLLAKIY